MPGWLGNVVKVGGAGLKDIALTVINPLTPVIRATAKVGEASATTINKVADSTASGFKWAAFLIVGAIAIYALAVLGPFIPKPKGA